MPVGSREGRKKNKINFSFPAGVFLFLPGVLDKDSTNIGSSTS